MSNRYDDRRGRRPFRRGYADEYDRERLREALNRPGFGRMGDDRDYLDEGRYDEDSRGLEYRSSDYGPRRGQARPWRGAGHAPYDAAGESGYVPGMESEYARNRVTGSYGREPMSGAGGEGRRWREARTEYGAELGDAGTFGSGNHYLGDDFDTRDPRGRWGGAREEGRGLMDRAADEVRSWFGDEGAERRRDRDERGIRGYSGRGPRGYRRSDARIHEDVCDRLTDDDYLDATDIEVQVETGIVTLSGTAEDRRAKRWAEQLAERVVGVSDVINQIRVRATDRSSAT